MRIIVALLTATVLVACARDIKLETTFNAEEAKFINISGKSAISGQLFLRRNDGVVVYGAGSPVGLIPSTTYARERLTKLYGNAKMLSSYSVFKFEGDDPEYRKFMKITKADGQGKFNFPNLSAGEYFLIGTVTWCAPSQYGCITQGGSLMEKVKLAGGENKDVIMNGM